MFCLDAYHVVFKGVLEMCYLLTYKHTNILLLLFKI